MQAKVRESAILICKCLLARISTLQLPKKRHGYTPRNFIFSYTVLHRIGEVKFKKGPY